MSPDSRTVERLLDDAADAVERADWRVALDLADNIIALDAGNADALAIRTLARLRARRSERSAGTRRQLTVMFCDLVGSTALAAALDPEETREVLLRFQNCCTEVVTHFEGHVAQFIGDGILVYFGHPRAHEDDPLRAVLAGREIVERVGSLPPAGHRDAAIDLAVRIGIHTGLVVVADMGTERRTQANDVVGETPNLAARIQAAARPNAVVVSSDTYALVRNLVEVRPLPSTPLKGINRTVRLFEVLDERPVESRFDAAPRSPSLVGRRTEQEAIANAWTAATADGPQALALLGEPGIGKSRLLAFAKAHAKAEGGSYRTLQCSPYHVSTPLRPVALAMAREGAPGDTAGVRPRFDAGWLRSRCVRLGLDDPDDPYVLARLLGMTPPAELPVPDLAPDQLRERTFGVTLAWLSQLAGESPLLLAVEDLHWADPTTLEVLARLLSNPGPAPLLVVLTSRERAPVDEVGAVPTLQLGPLAPAECHELVHDTAYAALPPQTRQLIVDHSNGVPLYVEELTRMIGTAALEDLGPGEVEIPPTLHDLLVARVDQFLTEQRLVQVIATVGQPVRTALLRRLVGIDSEELDRQLVTLVEAGLLDVTGAEDRTYQFRHVLQRDAAYRLQLHSTRRAIHADVAKALAEEEFGVAPEVLAYHHERAGDLAAAAHHWYLAGVRHASTAAHTEAIAHYRRALDALHQAPSAPDPNFELDVQGCLSLSLLEARGYTSDEVAAAYGRLRDLAATTGGTRHHLPSVYGMWAYYHVRGENAVSTELANQLLDIALTSGDSQDVLAAKAVLGYQLMWGGRFREAAELLEEARSWSGDTSPFPHDPGVGAAVNLASALWMLGRPGAAWSTLDEALRRAEELDGPLADFTRAYTYCFAAALCHIAGNPEACAGHSNRAIQVSAERGFASWLGAGMLHVTVASALTGDPSHYIPGIRFGLDAWRDAGAESNRTHFLLGLAQALAGAGQPEEALAAVDEALAQAESTGELFLVSPLHCFRGELLARLAPGDGGAATAEFALALDVARRQEARAFEVAALTGLLASAPDGKGVDVDAAGELERLLATLDGDAEEPYVVAARSTLERL